MKRGFRGPYLGLLEAFGNPHLCLPPVIHVAGTNGKGSTIAFLRAILESAGYRVHVYTSPHLVRFNERIRLTGKEISDSELENLLDEAVSRNAGGEVTFFEITTAMAFAAFARIPADIILLETGLGGRLDCTNIVPTAAATIITTISGDHREILGPALTDIAMEKAGIIKPSVPCIVGEQTRAGLAAGVDAVFERKAAEQGGKLYRFGTQWSCLPGDPGKMVFQFLDERSFLPEPGLPGLHQLGNAGAALAALKVLEKDFPVSKESIGAGLRSVEWPARLQKITAGPLVRERPENWEIWLDGGHNDSAGEVLAAQARHWQETDGKDLHLVVGMMGTKHPAEFLGPLLPYAKTLSAVSIEEEPAALTPESILSAVPFFEKKDAFKTVQMALHALCERREKPARILICGSLYLAGIVLRTEE